MTTNLKQTLYFTFCFLSISVASANASFTKFYRSAEMDGRHQFIFQNELHGADTATCNCYRASYDDQGRLTGWSYLGAGFLQQDPSFKVARTEITYDGLFTTYRFFNNHGIRDYTPNGHYGEKFKIDTKMKNGGLYPYDRHDNLLHSDDNGVYRYDWVVNDQGYIVKEMNLNDDGIRIARKDGVFETNYTYDDNGRLKETNNYDKDGKLVSAGAATIRNTYDSDGHLVTILFLNSKGDLREDSGEAAKVDMKYDQWGYENSRTLYDAFGSVILIKTWVQDERGNVIEQRKFGPDESLVSHDPIIEMAYDNRNIKTDVYKRDKRSRLRVHVHYVSNAYGDAEEEACTDSMNRPALDDDSYSTIKQTWDDNGHVTSAFYLGTDGNPIGREQDSVAFIYYSHNSSGLVTEIKCLDANKNLHESDEYGAARVTVAYNDDDDITEVHRYDRNGKEIAQEAK